MATLEQVLLGCREQADGEDSSRWTPDAVLAALDLTFRREWNNILDSAPYLRTNVVSVMSDASGVVPFASLTTGTGDNARIARNIIQISDGQHVFEETRIDLVPPTPDTTRYAFYVANDEIRLLPEAVQSIRAVVNWRPVAPSDLAGTSSIVDFPADGIVLLQMATAAILLSKGGTETSEASALMNVAKQIREDMLSSLRRRTGMPKFMRYPDSSKSWGSR